MAITCPVGFNTQHMSDEVRATYERVATDPESPFHFNLGAEYAMCLLRYDPNELATLPTRATARFAGVGNPHRIGPIHDGETVVDIGSGGGTDLLLAARRVGKSGKAIGIDPTQGMRDSVLAAASEAGFAERVATLNGTFEEIPLSDSSADVVISNGVLNLALDKRRAFAEVYRVLKPGGRFYLADVFLGKELKESERSDANLWAGCVAGALLEAEAVALAEAAGFHNCAIVERFDCFRGSRVEKNVSPTVDVHGANFKGHKLSNFK